MNLPNIAKAADFILLTLPSDGSTIVVNIEDPATPITQQTVDTGIGAIMVDYLGQIFIQK